MTDSIEMQTGQSETPSLWLFSYGTLQNPEVQRGTFGRLLEGAPDGLPGYRTRLETVTDPEVIALSGTAEHPVLVATGNGDDMVEGWAFLMSEAEIKRADAYEAASHYRRIAIRLSSGRDAFAYMRGA